MKVFHKLSIALMGAVAVMAIAQLTPVLISTKVPSITAAAKTKAENFFFQGEEKNEKGDYQGAVAAYTQAIAIDPNYIYAYNSRGIVGAELGDKQGALADFNEVVRINPNSAEAHNNRGNARSQLGDNQGAIADFNEAVRINPNYAKAYYNRGNTRDDLGDKQGAIQDYQKAAELFQQQGDKDKYQKALNNIKKLLINCNNS